MENTDTIIDNAIQSGQDVVDITDGQEGQSDAAAGVEQAEGQSQDVHSKSDEDLVPFPKKAINALSRRDRQIGKLRAEMQAAKQELAALRSSMSNPKKEDEAPREEDYYDKSYGEFLKDTATFAARQEAGKHLAQQRPQLTQEQVQQQHWAMQRQAVAMEKAQEASKAIPDFLETVEEYGDVLDELPPHVSNLILSSDNPALATYNLIKSGRIENLASVPREYAALEVFNAAQKAVVPAKRVSSAPNPISAVRGAGASTNKRPEEMSGKDLLAWVRSE